MKNRVLLITGLGVSFLLGVLAFAFLPGLFSTETADAQSGGSGRVIEIAVEQVIKDGDGNETIVAGLVTVDFENPPKVPQVKADAEGIYVGHDQDRVTVGTGNIAVEVEIEQINDQEPVMAVSAVHSGPEVEFMVSPDATIYLETTEQPKPTPAEVEAGQMTMLRTFEPGSLSDLDKNTIIEAWGQEENGILMADKLIISPIK